MLSLHNGCKVHMNQRQTAPTNHSMFEFVHWVYQHAVCITCNLQSSILNPDASEIELPFQHLGQSWVLFTCSKGQVFVPHCHYTVDSFFKKVLWNKNNQLHFGTGPGQTHSHTITLLTFTELVNYNPHVTCTMSSQLTFHPQ